MLAENKRNDTMTEELYKEREKGLQGRKTRGEHNKLYILIDLCCSVN